MFQANFVLFQPQTWNHQISKGALAPFIRKWYLETKIRYAHCYWDVLAFSPSQL